MKKTVIFLLAVCLGIGAGTFLSLTFQVTSVNDNSMLPAYKTGDRILVNRMAYGGKEDPDRGDVVLLPNQVYAVTGESSVMMKRVIAVGGDLVMITDGKVYVNNKALEEDYVFTDGISGEMEQVTVPEGRVFVMGDNRAASTDSRSETVGLAAADDIQGKVIFKW